MTGYVKMRFTSKKHGSTAGLILTAEKAKSLSIYGLSRMFPYSECRKMEKVEVSQEYENWEDAFNHQFEEQKQ